MFDKYLLMIIAILTKFYRKVTFCTNYNKHLISVKKLLSVVHIINLIASQNKLENLRSFRKENLILPYHVIHEKNRTEKL